MAQIETKNEKIEPKGAPIQQNAVENERLLQNEPQNDNNGSLVSDIENDFKGVEAINRKVREQESINKELIKEKKIELLKEFYAVLEGLGFDPADPQQINSFLEYLDKQDPDLLKLFETAFNVLDPDAGNTAPSPVGEETMSEADGIESLEDENMGPPEEQEEEENVLLDRFSNMRDRFN
jgi:hypothetical protein